MQFGVEHNPRFNFSLEEISKETTLKRRLETKGINTEEFSKHLDDYYDLGNLIGCFIEGLTEENNDGAFYFFKENYLLSIVFAKGPSFTETIIPYTDLRIIFVREFVPKISQSGKDEIIILSLNHYEDPIELNPYNQTANNNDDSIINRRLREELNSQNRYIMDYLINYKT